MQRAEVQALLLGEGLNTWGHRANPAPFLYLAMYRTVWGIVATRLGTERLRAIQRAARNGIDKASILEV